jgi:branched-chain amino acid transport system substrate-binding protein
MSVARAAQPIKLGLLMDCAISASENRKDIVDSLKRVKMLPAACGSAGTRISFGKWAHRGWMGAGYLVARSLDPNGERNGTPWATHLVGRYGQD